MKYEYSSNLLHLLDEHTIWKPLNRREALKKISKGSMTLYPEKVLDELDSGKRAFLDLGGHGILRHVPRKFISGYKDMVKELYQKTLNQKIAEHKAISNNFREKGLIADSDAHQNFVHDLEKLIKG